MNMNTVKQYLKFCVPAGIGWMLCVLAAFFWAVRNGILGPSYWYDTPVLIALFFAVPVFTAVWAWRRVRPVQGLFRRILHAAPVLVVAVLLEIASAAAAWLVAFLIAGGTVRVLIM